MAKGKTGQEPELIRHDGGLCPHFVNTGSDKRRPIRRYADLLVWGRRADVLGSADAQRLERAAAERPADAEAVFARARELRTLLERILLALAGRRSPAGADVNALSDALGAALSAQRLVPAAEGGWLVDWGDRGGDDLDRMLWPVILSAVDMLSPRYYRRIRRCAGDDCELIFADRLPGRARLRCRRCSSRYRSRKHYRTKVKPARKRQEQRSAEYMAELRKRQELSRREASDEQPLNKRVC